ncbi:MAG: Mov34/MPN/PAD-1 family protein [Candidatus Bathyarchaeia archaeon]|nr:Mov34/MPN/PAD-1 family protein [Candidatus Bathyarchaeota archaeon]
MKIILIRRSVIDSILSYARMCHPREGILLLRGKFRRDSIIIEDIVIPPMSVRGEGFSTFPAHMLPLDLSIVGTAHSHPSGHLSPSTGDLNNFYGRIMIIAAYPYRSEDDIAVIDRWGKRIGYAVID